MRYERGFANYNEPANGNGESKQVGATRPCLPLASGRMAVGPATAPLVLRARNTFKFLYKSPIWSWRFRAAAERKTLSGARSRRVPVHEVNRADDW